MLIHFLVILLVLIVHRLLLVRLYRAYFRNGWERDAAEHIQLIDQLRQTNIKHIDHFMITSEMTNPYLYHRLCSVFSKPFLTQYSYLPNIVLYCLSGCLGYWLFVQYFHLSNIQLDQNYLLIFIVFFICMPVNNFFVDANCSYISLSERYLALMLTAASTYLFALYNLSGDLYYFMLSLACAVLLNMASKFARQAYFLFFACYFLFTWQSGALLHLLLGMSLPLLIWGKYYWRSLVSQIKYFGIYRTILSPSANQRRGLETFEFSFKNLTSFSKQPLRSLVFYLPVFLVAPMIEHDLWLLNLIPILLFVLVSNKYLSFIGESFRYIEFLSYYLIPLYAILIYQKWGGIWMAAYALITVVFFLHYYRKINKDQFDTLDRMIDVVGINSTSTLLTYSMRVGLNIAARTGCHTLWWQPGGLTNKALWKKYIGHYPYLHTDIDALLDCHQFTHIVCKKSELKKMPSMPELNKFKVLYEDFYFIVYSPEITCPEE